MPDWVETVGKLGPASVAVAVLLANLRQTAWSNSVTRRTALMEDQKLRLGLLDRRLTVIEIIAKSRVDLRSAGRPRSDVLEQLETALRTAPLIFGESERRAIAGAAYMLHDIVVLDRELAPLGDSDDQVVDLRGELHDRSLDLRIALADHLYELHEALIDASKVSPVPALDDQQANVSGLGQGLRFIR